MYVALKPGAEATPEVSARVGAAIETEIGKVARPRNVWIVPDMPKTRSGKIMRRVIAGISNFTSPGDVTTLADPSIVEVIKQQVQSQKVQRGETPRELSKEELNRRIEELLPPPPDMPALEIK